MGSTPAGVSGDGALAVVTLAAQAEGTTPLSFTAAQLSDVPGDPQAITSQSGAQLTVTAACAIPDAPILLSPAANATLENDTPTFDWSPTTDTPAYQLQVGVNANLSEPTVNVTTTTSTYTPAAALPPDTWYWRVRARNVCGTYGAWSAVRAFTVTAPPAAALHIAPATATLRAGETTTVTVAVSDVVDLGSFEFTLAHDPAILNVTDVHLAEFPPSTGRTFTPVGPTSNATVGTVTFGAYSMGSTPAGVSGDGALAVVTLAALTVGADELSFQSAKVTSITGEVQTLANSYLAEIKVVEDFRVFLPAILR
jgi:hypothetical protein